MPTRCGLFGLGYSESNNDNRHKAFEGLLHDAVLLFRKDVCTINEHIQGVPSEVELAEESVIRKFRTVPREGEGEAARDLLLVVGAFQWK